MVKKIHCCWFGTEMPDSVKRNLNHWKSLNPDFEICLYTEDNIDVSGIEYAERALFNKKWAFLSDIVRLQALYSQGGVYMDMDVELIKPLSFLSRKDANKLVMGYMYDCALGTAVIYSPPRHHVIGDVLKRYDMVKSGFYPVNNSVFTEYFINSVPGFLLNGKEWENESCHVYPKEYFEQPAFIRNHGMSIHHCCGSWKSHDNGRFGVAMTISYLAHLKKWVARKWRTYCSCRKNEFYEVHKAALRGEFMPFYARWYYTD